MLNFILGFVAGFLALYAIAAVGAVVDYRRERRRLKLSINGIYR